jgi:hypothetical protein
MEEITLQNESQIASLRKKEKDTVKISDTHPLFDTQLLDIFCSLLWIIYQKENLGDRILYFGNVSNKLLYYSS